MSAWSEIKAEVEETFGVSGANVYNGTDYDGAIQRTGWWYKPFGQTPFFLGVSKVLALVTLGQIQEERADTRP